ncbi:zinc finger A20 and AN1 domain-containing stress-associated protein 6 [Andrographis paniculata]|uniref:zinc finger A20 and AN1 domain-containing stress-associated protein 6 n=1 Tax=Andrographis paniculata TaxID=175694 RepID=UPI0021E71192|nr:zinc finger A20 and AN1 domain-containing stress-associated protein 6 [Andrographis paniculata]
MAEEHGFQSPEGHRLCVNNCGFFGSPATQGMCSKCYRDLCLQKSGESALFSPPLTSAPPSSSSSPAAPQPSAAAEVSSFADKVEAAAPAVVAAQATNRCSSCRKKVGLTGFRCRCGLTFCGGHRYAEKHGCTFDFKAMGREAIAKANPVVKGEKLEKI